MPDLHLQLEQESDDPDHPGMSLPPLPEAAALAMMRRATITDARLIPWGSNYTFAVALEDEEYGDRLAIYKPRRGEAPLWDFTPGTLYRREHASYLLSCRMGWGLVPPTIIRRGPHGIGSVQLYVEPKPGQDEDYEFWGAKRIEIERMVMFDHIANNADRKLSHCLRGVDDRIWGIDHGLTLNLEPKLRTVLWQYVAQPISGELMADLERFLLAEAEVREELQADLQPEEIDALMQRARMLHRAGNYPELDPGANVPRGWW
jgi:hypothetical protein